MDIENGGAKSDEARASAEGGRAREGDGHAVASVQPRPRKGPVSVLTRAPPPHWASSGAAAWPTSASPHFSANAITLGGRASISRPRESRYGPSVSRRFVIGCRCRPRPRNARNPRGERTRAAPGKTYNINKSWRWRSISTAGAEEEANSTGLLLEGLS